MFNPFTNPEVIKEISPLEKLAKEYKMLPDRILNSPIESKNLDNYSQRNGEQLDGQTENTGSPRRIKTINDDLSGQKHPETGVPYEGKEVVNDKGEKVVGVFPQFESKFDAQLPEGMEKSSDKTQFYECNRQLKEKCDNDPSFKAQFNERQQNDINEGRTPYGYTWHHNEETGKMQLVDYETHWKTRHTGGRSIWGGGTENR